MRDSSLCQAFLDEEYELAEGEHIRSEDNGKILISKALAEQNNLAVGDKITLTHAKLVQTMVYIQTDERKKVHMKQWKSKESTI